MECVSKGFSVLGFHRGPSNLVAGTTMRFWDWGLFLLDGVSNFRRPSPAGDGGSMTFRI